MNSVPVGEFNSRDESLSSVVWRDLGTERRHGEVVTRQSCVIENLPALLVVELCNIRGSAVSALVRLRMVHARDGLSAAVQLEDVGTSVGVFLRRVWELGPERQRTVIAAAAEVDGGPDAIVQFVIPGVSRDAEELESLSLLSISKVLEMYEPEAPN